MSTSRVEEVLQEADQLVLGGQVDEATRLLETARDSDPSNQVLLQRLGDAYRSLQRPTEALQVYDEAIRFAPGQADLWARKGDALLGDGRTEEAIAAFEEAARLNPDEFSYVDWNIRGDRLFTDGDYATAGRLYRKSVEATANVEAWRNLGFVAQRLGDPAQALECYEAALLLDPENSLLLNDRGVVLLDLERTDEARECFERVVALNGDSLEGWLNLGLVRREKGEFEGGAEAYQRAAQLDPARSDTWLDLGVCELEIGSREAALPKALQSFERALEANEDSFWARNNAGFVLGELGREREGLAHLVRAIELDPSESTPWSNKVWILLKLGEVEEAAVAADEMMEATGDRVSALNFKAQILTDWKGQDKDALALLEEASHLNPDDLSVAVNLAELLLKVGEYPKSRSAAQAALEMELADDSRCAMLFITYASFVLEGGASSDRQQAFDDFIGYYRANFVGTDARALLWNYRGLIRGIRNDATKCDEESAFLLTTAMDMQVGTL
ncbi:MAG: tetratricopeptide repeat protein, partial [Actinomycetota bacterium]|nr:tetratricopeptide repeat protein [Actinomycetota bacterium]